MRPIEWHAQVDARVTTGPQLVIEPQVEVAILLIAAEPGPFNPSANQQAVFNLPRVRRRAGHALPAVQIAAVEERFEIRLVGSDVDGQAEQSRGAYYEFAR
jgi:hypothetical protein